ncbi:PC4 domain-containing protein, partial [Nephila pilipes]
MNSLPFSFLTFIVSCRSEKSLSPERTFRTMFCHNTDFNYKCKCKPLDYIAKKMSFNANEPIMNNLPKHMIHHKGLIFISVNTFQKQTRVHIRLYVIDDRRILHPTKDGVSMKPEVWSALQSQLSSFRIYEKFESEFIVKKDICLFNLSDKDNECVSIQRLFQRKASPFQFFFQKESFSM